MRSALGVLNWGGMRGTMGGDGCRVGVRNNGGGLGRAVVVIEGDKGV